VKRFGRPGRRRTLIAALATMLTVATSLAVPTTGTAAPSGTTSRPARTGLDPAVFAHPGGDTRPTMLWFWNGTITTQLIDSQLAELRNRGIFSAVIFPFDTANLQPAFFTNGWFDMVGHALHEAQNHGMKLWLFNDDHFPSGRAAGLVVKGGQVGNTTYAAHPELRAQGVTRDQSTVTGPATISLVSSPTGLSVAAGRLVVDAARLNGVATLRTGAAWTDYTFTSDLRLGTSNAGFVVRATDPRNGYLVDVRPDGSIEIYKQVDGSFTLLTTTPALPAFDAAAEHHLKVIVHGATITPTLDGTALPGVTDATFPAGTVGVRAVATQKSTRDNWTVTAADGASLYTQDFTSPSALDEFVNLPNPPVNSVVSASARPAGSTDAAKIVDLTAQATGSGTWQVPAGDWTVDTFSKTYLDGDNGYLDLMDPQATQRLMDIVPGEYYRRFPWAFGSVLKGFWDDEPYIASATAHFNTFPWTPGLPTTVAGAGAALGPALSAAYDDLGRSGRVLRGKYWQSVSDLFARSYYKVQGDWMAAHHVGFISNPLWDEYGPAEQVRSTGDLSKDNQWAQVPGTDVIFNQYQPGGRTMLPRYPASAAHQNGADKVLLESFGGHGWDTDPQYMQATLGAFAVRGINLNALHALWTDPNNVVYPTQFEGMNPWWNQSNPLNDWIGRIDYVASGQAVAPTALIVPEQASQAWPDGAAAAAIDTHFTAANNALEDAQTDFDLLPDAALSGDPAVRTPARVSHGALAVGDQRYRLAVLPQTPTISLATVSTLTSFVRSGGTLAAIGTLPAEETDGHDSALAAALRELFAAGPNAATSLGSGQAVRIATPAGLAAATTAAGVAAAQLSPAAPAVRVLRVKTGNQTAFLINNESGTAVHTAATFPVSGRPQTWDPRTGTTVTAPAYEVGAAGTTVPLTLQPYETTIVVVDPKAPVSAPHLVLGGEPVTDLQVHRDAMTGRLLVAGDQPVHLVGQSGSTYFGGEVPAVAGLDPLRLDGDWSVQLEKPGAVETAQPLRSWTTTDPGYTGAATYRRSFDVPAGALRDRRWTLDLGDVGSAAQVVVNGHAFDPVLWKPYELDVTSALVEGSNTISVRVTNTLANTHGIAKASGLLGPVTLTPAQWVPFRLPAAPHAGLLSITPEASVQVAPGQTVSVPVIVRRYGGTGGPVPVSAQASAGLTVALSSPAPYVGRNDATTLTMSVTATTSASVPGSGSVTLNAAGADYTVPVHLELASRFGVASASSTYDGHPVASVNDGDLSSAGWDQGQGWNDATIDAFPDSVTVTFAAPAPISDVTLYTLDSSAYPATQEGVLDVDLEVLVDGSWTTVGTIRNNASGHMSATFPAVRASAVRATILNSRDHYSRVIELQARP
jgi:hypothetical protein